MEVNTLAGRALDDRQVYLRVHCRDRARVDSYRDHDRDCCVCCGIARRGLCAVVDPAIYGPLQEPSFLRLVALPGVALGFRWTATQTASVICPHQFSYIKRKACAGLPFGISKQSINFYLFALAQTTTLVLALHSFLTAKHMSA